MKQGREIDTEAYVLDANFERIEPEELDEDGWMILLPEARFGKLMGSAVLVEAYKPKKARRGGESKGRKIAKDRRWYGNHGRKRGGNADVEV